MDIINGRPKRFRKKGCKNLTRPWGPISEKERTFGKRIVWIGCQFWLKRQLHAHSHSTGEGGLQITTPGETRALLSKFDGGTTKEGNEEIEEKEERTS